MDYTHFLTGALFVIFLFGLFNNSKQNKQIKNMQKQINELCRLTGHKELVSVYLTDEEREVILHLKNTGKNIEAVKKVRELTGLELEEAKKYVDSI